MSALASYTETFLFGHYRFDLHEDVLVWSGTHWIRGDFEVRIELQKLSPEPDRYWFRRSRNGQGIVKAVFWIAMFLAFLYLFLAYESHSRMPDWAVAIPLLAIPVILVTIPILFLSPKKEFAYFKYADGRWACWIGRRGREKDSFDEFVNRVTEQIRVARAKAEQSAGKQ